MRGDKARFTRWLGYSEEADSEDEAVLGERRARHIGRYEGFRSSGQASCVGGESGSVAIKAGQGLGWEQGLIYAWAGWRLVGFSGVVERAGQAVEEARGGAQRWLGSKAEVAASSGRLVRMLRKT